MADHEYGFWTNVKWAHISDVTFPESDGPGSVRPTALCDNRLLPVNGRDDYVMLCIVSGAFHARSNDPDQSIMAESTYRRLAEDFPDSFVTIDYNDGQALAVPALILDADEHLREIVAGLSDDWPCYDESDVSDLTHERMRESWDEYVRDDLLRELRHRSVDDDQLDDIPDDTLREFFTQAVQDHPALGDFTDRGEWAAWSDLAEDVHHRVTQHLA